MLSDHSSDATDGICPGADAGAGRGAGRVAAETEVDRHVREFLDGRPDAVHRVYGWVRSVVLNKVWGFEDADDIAQAALLAIVKNLRQGRFEPENLRAYARAVAKNMCISHYRRLRSRGCHVSFEADEAVAADSRSAEQVVHRTVLESILGRLGEGCRQIMDLAYVQGQTCLEISKRLGISEAAVRVRLYRCIRKARALLEAPDGLDPQPV